MKKKQQSLTLIHTCTMHTIVNYFRGVVRSVCVIEHTPRTRTHEKCLVIVCESFPVTQKAPTHQQKASFLDEIYFCERIKQKSEFNLFLEMYHHDHETFHHCFCTITSKSDFLLSKVGICLNSVVLKFPIQPAVVAYNKHGNCRNDSTQRMTMCRTPPLLSCIT